MRLILAAMSLSARRAWIEIAATRTAACGWIVALRKESVDRNAQNPAGDIHRPPSLSARRAWIEIVGGTITADPIFRRSPQGERG